MSRPGFRRFSEMNKGVLGWVGIALTLALLLGAFSVGRVLSVFGGRGYTAEFTESGQLKSGDKVRVSGLEVGKVTAVHLEHTRIDPKVLVSFRISADIPLGDRSTAAVATATALGTRYLNVVPRGTGSTGRTIPVARTVAPYTLDDALAAGTAELTRLDAASLAQSFNTVAQTLTASEPDLKDALQGVAALSQTISSRDGALQQLFANAKGVTGVLAARNSQLVQLMADGSQIFTEIQARRDDLTRLLTGLQTVSTQLTGLVTDNATTLGPVLKQLRDATTIVTDHRDQITFLLQRLAPYARALGEAVGSGPFFDAFLENLVPTSVVALLPSILNNARGGTPSGYSAGAPGSPAPARTGGATTPAPGSTGSAPTLAQLLQGTS